MKALIVWIAYVWAKTLAGLAIHPYQSVKRIVMGEQVLLPVVLSPLFALMAFAIIGRVGSFVLNLSGWTRELMAMILGSTLIGLMMWQLLLIALVYRFWRAR